MKVFHGFDSLPLFRRPVATLGSYDGVHAGHRILLERIMELAAAEGGESVVITFSPHPRFVLEGERCGPRLLNTLSEKIMLLDGIGIDNLIVAPFTAEFSRISSYDFIRDYLVGRVGVGTLVVGYDHHFGHNKEGDTGYLEHLQRELGFDVYEIPRQEMEHDKVSSTVIRRLIERGEMSRAAARLTYPYFAVMHIEALSEEGISLRTDEKCKLLPPAGRYGVKVHGGAGLRRAVLCVGSGGTLFIEGHFDHRAGDVIKVTFC